MWGDCSQTQLGCCVSWWPVSIQGTTVLGLRRGLIHLLWVLRWNQTISIICWVETTQTWKGPHSHRSREQGGKRIHQHPELPPSVLSPSTAFFSRGIVRLLLKWPLSRTACLDEFHSWQENHVEAMCLESWLVCSSPTWLRWIQFRRNSFCLSRGPEAPGDCTWVPTSSALESATWKAVQPCGAEPELGGPLGLSPLAF